MRYLFYFFLLNAVLWAEEVVEMNKAVKTKVVNIMVISGSLLESNTGNPTTVTTITLKNLNQKIDIDQEGFFSFSIPYQPTVKFILDNDSLFLEKDLFFLDSNEQYYNWSLIVYQNKNTLNTTENLEMVNVSKTVDQNKFTNEIVVTAEKEPLHERKEISVRSFDRKTVKEVAGGLGDPVRVLGSIPGISVQSDVSIIPLIRGGGQEETRVFFDGIPILKPYHTLGAFSVFSENSIEETKIYLGGFPAKYHNALSGMLNLKPRIPSMTKSEFSISADLIQGRLFWSTPIIEDRLNIYFSFGTLWLSHVIKAFLFVFTEGSERVSAISSTFPTFVDYQFGVNFQAASKIKVSYHFLAPLDKFSFVEVVKKDVDLLSTDTIAQVERNNYLHHVKLFWDVNSKTDIILSSAYQYQDWNIKFGEKYDQNYIFLNLDETQYNQTWSIHHRLNKTHQVEMGLQSDINIQTFNTQVPRFLYDILIKGNYDLVQSISLFNSDPIVLDNINDLSALTEVVETIFIREKGENSIIRSHAYVNNTWIISSTMKLQYGVRLGFRNIDDIQITPRINLFVKQNKQSEWSFSIGRYSQDNFDFYIYHGSPKIRSEKVFQVNAEWSYDIFSYLHFEWQNYYKIYSDLVVANLYTTGRIYLENVKKYLPQDVLEALIDYPVDSASIADLPPYFRQKVLKYVGEKELSYTNQGTGFAVGSEVSLFYDPTTFWKGWFSLELLSSQRDDKNGTQAYNFSNYRPWSLNWVNYFNMPGEHILSLRWKYTSGLPYTKIDLDNKTIGKRNANRYSPYNRFDIRLSKESTLFGTRFVSYFEIWNAFNSPNIVLRDSETREIQYFSISIPFPVVFLGFEWSF